MRHSDMDNSHFHLITASLFLTVTWLTRYLQRRQLHTYSIHRQLLPGTMQSINRFLYGPTPEERIRAWQAKLRSESRQLDRQMREVYELSLLLRAVLKIIHS